MTEKRFDVLVVGSGPAGSIAALVLAHGRRAVALVDKAAFPRDKACGDLIGPRGVQLLRDLALDVPDAVRVSDMFVVGPTGNRVRLPAPPGVRIRATGSSCSDRSSTRRSSAPRSTAGAEFFDSRADEPIGDEWPARRVLASSSTATGASRCDRRCRRRDKPRRRGRGSGRSSPGALGLRSSHLPRRSRSTPTHHVVDAGSRPRLPGIRLGVPRGRGPRERRPRCRRARRSNRRPTRRRDLDAFIEHAARVGVIDARTPVRPSAPSAHGSRWDSSARRRRVIASSSSATLQAWSIRSKAKASRRRWTAVGPRRLRSSAASIERPVATARTWHTRTLNTLSTTASLHRSLLRRPRLVAALTRGLTSPGVGRSLAGGWSIMWNDLLDGAEPGVATGVDERPPVSGTCSLLEALTGTGSRASCKTRHPDERAVDAVLGELDEEFEAMYAVGRGVDQHRCCVTELHFELLINVSANVANIERTT